MFVILYCSNFFSLLFIVFDLLVLCSASLFPYLFLYRSASISLLIYIYIYLLCSLVKFIWHQKRAVSLTRHQIWVHKSNALSKDKEICKKQDKSKKDKVSFFIYCYYLPSGADSEDSSESAACKISFYSRHCGRFITEMDACDLLGISKTGSDFAQGLRIIVFDNNGELPLSPQKTKISWNKLRTASGIPTGKTFEENLNAEIRFVVKQTWKYDGK